MDTTTKVLIKTLEALIADYLEIAKGYEELASDPLNRGRVDHLAILGQFNRRMDLVRQLEALIKELKA